MKRKNIFSLGIVLLLAATCYAQTSQDNIDKSLRDIYRRDQQIRQNWANISQMSDADSLLLYYQQMAQVDSLNQAYVFALLDDNGWPQSISDSAHHAIFLVIDHAELKAQKQYFPFVKAQSEKGHLAQSDVATLQDRILMRENKRQIFGTQTKNIRKDGNSYTFVWPIEQPESVDSLRQTVGLPTMQEYIHMFKEAGVDVTWDKQLTPEEASQLSTPLIIKDTEP